MNTSDNFLLIDDDEIFCSKLGAILEKRGENVLRAQDGSTALALAANSRPRKILLDLRLESENGLELIQPLRKVCPDAEIVVLTGYGSIATALDAIHRGARHYLTKPASIHEILASFDKSPASEELAQDSNSSTSPTLKTPSLSQVEWEHIQRVLIDCEGNVTRAAKTLGLHRRSLQRKLARNP